HDKASGRSQINREALGSGIPSSSGMTRLQPDDDRGWTERGSVGGSFSPGDRCMYRPTQPRIVGNFLSLGALMALGCTGSIDDRSSGGPGPGGGGAPVAADAP